MSFSISGLVSGLDTGSIISQMMAVQQQPIVLLQNREAGYQAKISALGTLSSALSDLQNSAQALEDPTAFSSFTAASGNTDVLTASASQDAAVGNYQVEVDQLAQAQQVRSAVFTGADQTVGTGTLTIQVGNGASVDVAIDSGDDTLAGIATAINAADAGVTAGVLDDGNGSFYLTLNSQETGADNTINFTVSDSDGNNDDASGLSALYTNPANHTLTETQSAKNSQLTLNGIAVQRSGNTIDDLIGGMTLTLNQADPGNPFSLTVSRDTGNVESKVQDFISKYNSLVDTTDSLQSYDATTQTAGTLLGDSATNMVVSQLQGLLSTTLSGVSDSVNSLSNLGISVDRYGQLSLDDSKLTDALQSNLDDVTKFFTNTTTGNEGFAVKLDNTLNGYLDSTNGVIPSEVNGFQSSITDIDNQITNMNTRLSLEQDTLTNQFNALEVLLSDLQSSSSALDQQLQSLSALNTQIAQMGKSS
jgi:flagellar hook-associated protein 2